MKPNFRVLGAGIWGLTFSDYLMQLDHNVEVFCRDTDLNNKNLKDITFDKLSQKHIKPLESLEKVNKDDVINIIAADSKGFCDLLEKHETYFNSSKRLISLTKGIDHNSGYTFNEVIKRYTSNNVQYGLLSGPSFARDLCMKKNISVSFASLSKSLSDIVEENINSKYFKIIPTAYICQIEIAGIIKNIAAILSGFSDAVYGKGKYTNLIIKKACDEAWNVAYKIVKNHPIKYEMTDGSLDRLLTDKENIVTSPGFIGDMILTCKQRQSRNYQFGELLADENTSVEQAKSVIGTVEGYECSATLIDKSPYESGELTKLLYKLLHTSNFERKSTIKDFLQV